MASIEFVEWGLLENEIKVCNPDFHGILNTISKRLDEKFLYKATYQYGELIVKEGKFNYDLFNNEKELKPNLDYADVPLSIAVNHECEIFIDYKKVNPKAQPRNIPLRILKAGELFGVFETVRSIRSDKERSVSNIFNVSSGYQSLVIDIPKREPIKEQLKQKTGIDFLNEDKWNHYLGHPYEFIMEINTCVENQFYTDVILLPKNWIFNNKPIDLKLHNYILDTHSIQSDNLLSGPLNYAEIEKIQPAYNYKNNQPFYIFFHQAVVSSKKGKTPTYRPLTFEDSNNPLINCLKFLRDNISKEIFIFYPTYLNEDNPWGIHSLTKPAIILTTRKDIDKLRAYKEYAEKMIDIKNDNQVKSHEKWNLNNIDFFYKHPSEKNKNGYMGNLTTENPNIDFTKLKNIFFTAIAFIKYEK